MDNGGAGQAFGVILAVLAIEAGLANTILGCGVDAWSRTHHSEEARIRNETRRNDQEAGEFGPEYGYFGAAAAYAFGARRHMDLYGTKREHFAEIAIRFREHALRNPSAAMKTPLTREDYFSSRMIVEPFCLFRLQLAK